MHRIACPCVTGTVSLTLRSPVWFTLDSALQQCISVVSAAASIGRVSISIMDWWIRQSGERKYSVWGCHAETSILYRRSRVGRRTRAGTSTGRWQQAGGGECAACPWASSGKVCQVRSLQAVAPRHAVAGSPLRASAPSWNAPWRTISRQTAPSGILRWPATRRPL